MLHARGLRVLRGGVPVLDGVTVSVEARTRLGIVGPNGVGKTTLLRVLAGLVDLDGGAIERSPAELTVGYLTQEPDATPGETLAAYLARRTGVAAAEAELDERTERLGRSSDPDAIDAYTRALDAFLALGGDDFAARAGVVCADVGLPANRMDVPVSDLSGGQAARAGLAAILLARFDVFLLDEPTNDLDFAGLDRLEAFLESLPGGVAVVSHDRAFLDRSVGRILEIDEHTRGATEYAGGWSEYIERRAVARSQLRESYDSFVAERSRLSERIRTQRSWSEQGVKRQVKKATDHDTAQRGFRVNRTEKQASKVRQSERALDRLAAVDKPWEGWELHLDLAPRSRSGDVVARLHAMVAERGAFSLGPVDLQLDWADRVAITGPNGGGKSTLLHVLTGQLAPVAGERWAGPGVTWGELDQARRRLASGATVLDQFVQDTGLRAEESRSLLAKFGLGADHVHRRFAALSPGERTRTLLAALMAGGTNALVLDEPTNHLDLPAIEQLEAALESYEGTLLVVTHDRWLLETLRVNRTWYVESGHVSEAT